MPNKSRTALILQDECYKHRYIRSKDVSMIVERPERLRALKAGFAGAIARLEERRGSSQFNQSGSSSDISDSLIRALDNLNITTQATSPSSIAITDVCEIIRLPVTLQYLSSDPAVRMIHAANETGDGYDNMEHLDRLAKWARESEDKIRRGECEIPEGFLQNDLYMCPQSYSAICGAVETIRKAVDTVMTSEQDGTRTAFAAIRPPGHHCGEDTPSGFCFVNNAAIGAAHAHLSHGVKRVIIFDIDLHHGNGTQAIAWAINAETHRRKLAHQAQLLAEGKAESTFQPPTLQIFYASLHDILSFPCEDGDATLVRDASVSIAGAHGQFIENMHLEPYGTHEEFWTKLYPRYRALFAKAEKFLQLDPQDTNVPVFISCGFDASEYEYESMSRHGRKVPPGFYYRFAKDARDFAIKNANGRVISVLEGGYSDRALIAGGIAHLVGLVERDDENGEGDESIWWGEKSIEQLESAIKPRKGKQSIGTLLPERWVERSVEILAAIDPPQSMLASSSRNRLLPGGGAVTPTSMHLRERKKGRSSEPTGVVVTDIPRQQVSITVDDSQAPGMSGPVNVTAVTPRPLDSARDPTSWGKSVSNPERKLPKIILRVRDPSSNA